MNSAEYVFIEDTTWSDVFAQWSKQESNMPEWQECATKVKGWSNWTEWRGHMASLAKLPARSWKRYQLRAPAVTLPSAYIGPFKSWQSMFPAKEANTHTFAELVAIHDYSTHTRVQSIIQNFPAQSELIALQKQDGSIICTEGHHRCTAVAYAVRNSINIHIPTNPTIAIAQLAPDTEEFLQTLLHSSSNKTK